MSLLRFNLKNRKKTFFNSALKIAHAYLRLLFLHFVCSFKSTSHKSIDLRNTIVSEKNENKATNFGMILTVKVRAAFN